VAVPWVFYFSDDGDLVALRDDRWKTDFAERWSTGFEVWQDPFVPLHLPRLFNLWGDLFERADHESSYYADWRVRRVFLLVPAQAFVVQLLQTFKEFPPRQKPASCGIDQVLERHRRETAKEWSMVIHCITMNDPRFQRSCKVPAVRAS
jgi:hypothetical protein